MLFFYRSSSLMFHRGWVWVGSHERGWLERDSNLTKYLIKHSIKILFDVSQGMSWDRVMRAVDWKGIKAQLGFYRSSSLCGRQLDIIGGNYELNDQLCKQAYMSELGLQNSADYSCSILRRSLEPTQSWSPTKAKCSFVRCKEWSVWSLRAA